MPKTLLLADDSVTIQKVVGISFANEDVVLLTVDNGDDAIVRAREARPDVVLADVVMPGKNGYEVCQAIKNDAELRHIPVLLLTGTFEAFDELRAQRAGADGHITKPFEAQALVDRVNGLLAETAAPIASADTAGTSAAAAPQPAEAPASETREAYDFFDDELTEPGPAPHVETQPTQLIESPSPALEAPVEAQDELQVSEGEDEAFSFEAPVGTDVEEPEEESAEAGEVRQDQTVLIASTDDSFSNAVTAPPAFDDTAPAEADAAEAHFEPVAEPAPEPAEDAMSLSATRLIHEPPADAIRPAASAEPMPEPSFDEPEPTPAVAFHAPEPEPTPEVAFHEPEPEPTPAVTFQEPEPEPEPAVSFHEPEPTPAATFHEPEPEPVTPVATDAADVSLESAEPLLQTQPEPPAELDLAPEEVALPEAQAVEDPLAHVGPADLASQAVVDPAGSDAYDVSSSDLGDPLGAATPSIARAAASEAPVAAPPAEADAPQADARMAASAVSRADFAPLLREEIHQTLEKIAWDAFGQVAESLVKQSLERVEKIAWEVIPRMAETLIQEEIRRLKAEEEAE